MEIYSFISSYFLSIFQLYSSYKCLKYRQIINFMMYEFKFHRKIYIIKKFIILFECRFLSEIFLFISKTTLTLLIVRMKRNDSNFLTFHCLHLLQCLQKPNLYCSLDIQNISSLSVKYRALKISFC